jgi:hypothetical protein
LFLIHEKLAFPITYLQIRKDSRLVIVSQFVKDFNIAGASLIAILIEIRCHILALMYEKPIRMKRIESSEFSH